MRDIEKLKGWKYLVLFVLITYGCSGVKKVVFETPVDTRSKPINNQIKKTYTIDNPEVYVSNEFDGARLNGVSKKNDSTLIVTITPENSPINNSAYYAFKAWSSKDQDVYFEFKYPLGYKHRYIPKIKSKGAWKKIDSTHVFKTDSIITVKLNLNSDPILVAAQEIQSSNHVKEWYTSLSNQSEMIKIKSAGKTLLGRNLPVLDIYKGKPEGKEIVVFLTRQHPPEVTGYYAFQYFLSTVVGNSAQSNKFFEKYRVIAFPIMNPDGVDLGHWRHNAGGVDTNRDWSKYHQPEVKQAVKFILKSAKESGTRIALGLDFHSTYYDIFYTNKRREGTTIPNFIDDWFNSLENNIEGYKVNEAAGNSTKPVSKGWFLYGHNAVGITYEIGDDTPKEKIKEIGTVSAVEMMRILSEAKSGN